jgi:hypothetical protein
MGCRGCICTDLPVSPVLSFTPAFKIHRNIALIVDNLDSFALQLPGNGVIMLVCRKNYMIIRRYLIYENKIRLDLSIINISDIIFHFEKYSSTRAADAAPSPINPVFLFVLYY